MTKAIIEKDSFRIVHASSKEDRTPFHSVEENDGFFYLLNSKLFVACVNEKRHVSGVSMQAENKIVR